MHLPQTLLLTTSRSGCPARCTVGSTRLRFFQQSPAVEPPTQLNCTVRGPAFGCLSCVDISRLYLHPATRLPKPRRCIEAGTASNRQPLLSAAHMDTAQQYLQTRAAHLLVAQEYLAQLVQTKALPPGGLPQDVLGTLIATFLLANLLVVMLVPRGRKAVLDTIETILAIILIIILVAIVLGLPLVILYLVLKGLAFALNTLLALPALAPLSKLLGVQ